MVEGSLQGGTLLYIRGYGFMALGPFANKVFVGARRCPVIGK
jgi:hypothetical protein